MATTLHLSSFDVSHVYSLVLVEWHGLTFSDHLHLYRRHVLQGTTDHPAITRHSVSSLHTIILTGKYNKTIGTQLVNKLLPVIYIIIHMTTLSSKLL